MRKSIVYLAVVISFCFFSFATSYSQILGCYQKEHGQLRVVTDFSECSNAEEPITISQSENAMSGTYQGEMCLGMKDYENGLRFRIGLFHLGDSYYSLSGIQMDQNGGKAALSGSAVMIDENLEMVISIVRVDEQDNGEREGDVYLSSQMGQIKWDGDEQCYNLSMIDAKQYYERPDDESIGDEYVKLVEIECPPLK